MSEVRYTSEQTDQETFSEFSPSHSPKNLLSTVICRISQMGNTVYLPQLPQMQSSLPSDQTEKDFAATGNWS